MYSFLNYTIHVHVHELRNGALIAIIFLSNYVILATIVVHK